MFTTLLSSVALCAILADAVAISARQSSTATTITAADLIKVAPRTASCDKSPVADECADANDAAKWINESFINFNVNTFGAQAALTALMLYETGDFKYSRNHFPGRPGQGTRNMQMPANNLKYAQWLATACKNCQISAQDVSQAQAQGDDAVLGLVNDKSQWSFSSAAWYLVTQCDASIQQNLASGSQEAWAAYVQQCVGTSLTDDRTQVWNAIMALKAW